MNSISKLSNDDLESRLRYLINRERQLLHLILEHICEVDRRKLYLERAYCSLFEYLVKVFGYSGSAAIRRQEAARLLRQVPQLGIEIQNGSINLSQIGEFSHAIQEKQKINFEFSLNKEDSKISPVEKIKLLEKIKGKTLQETQKILATELDLPVKEKDSVKFQQNDLVRLEVTLTKQQYEKFQTCRDKLSHILAQQHWDASWPSVLEILMDKYLKLIAPKMRAADSTQPIGQTAGPLSAFH